MGLARVAPGAVTGQKRWQLERLLEATAWERPASYRARQPMSGFDMVVLLWCWLDGFDDPNGTLPDHVSLGYGSTPEMVEDVAQYTGPPGTLWAVLVQSNHVSALGEGVWQWHDYQHFNARAIAARVNGRKRRTRGKSQPASQPASQRKSQSGVLAPTGRGRGRGRRSPEPAPTALVATKVAPAHVAALWNELCGIGGGMRRVASKLSAKRASKLRVLIKQHPAEAAWRAALGACAADPHWRGESKPAPGATKAWVGNLDSFITHADKWFDAGELPQEEAPDEDPNSDDERQRRRRTLRDLGGDTELREAACGRWRKAGLKW